MSNLQKIKNARRKAAEAKAAGRQAIADVARAAMLAEIERVIELHACYFAEHPDWPHHPDQALVAFDKEVADMLLQGLSIDDMTLRFPGRGCVWPPEIWPAVMRLL